MQKKIKTKKLIAKNKEEIAQLTAKDETCHSILKQITQIEDEPSFKNLLTMP